MSQINSDEFKKREELLQVAKQLLIQDYLALRGTHHQQWLRESQIAWKTKGVLIPYPTAKLFPTEQEVVAKALELYNKSNQPAASESNTPVEISEPTAPQVILEDETPMSYQDAITPSITEQLQAAYNLPVQTSMIDTGGVTEMPPSVPTITRVVQSGGDFVIIHEPINLDNSAPIAEPVVVEEPAVTQEPVVEEEPAVTQEPVVEEEPAPVKHSLLRTVLSGWLAKEKDKS